jgi:hypothetical protein
MQAKSTTGGARPFQRILLTGGAVGALMALAMPAHAQSLEQQQQDLAALRAQVQALTERLNSQEAALRQAKAETADQVKTAVAAMPAAKANWASETTISGRVYANLSNISAETDGVEKAPSGTAVDIKRAYIGVDHRFNDIYSGNITTDFQYSSAVGATEVYIKKAYLQAKYSDALTVRLGSADLPWVPMAEEMYGYRYLENVLVDRTKFGTSADWGVHVMGKLAGGKVSYAVSAINGQGYKVAPGTGNAPRTDHIDFEGRVSFMPIQNLTLAVGGYTGKLGKDVAGGAPTYHSANRFNLLAAYVTPKWRLGAEYFNANDWNNVNTVATDSAEGYSVFGSVALADKITAFGRYDWIEPKQDLSPTLKNNYFNLGVTYSPAKVVDLALIYKHEETENGTLSTSNGTIGGVTDGSFDEIGVYTQFRF